MPTQARFRCWRPGNRPPRPRPARWPPRGRSSPPGGESPRPGSASGSAHSGQPSRGQVPARPTASPRDSTASASVPLLALHLDSRSRNCVAAAGGFTAAWSWHWPDHLSQADLKDICRQAEGFLRTCQETRAVCLPALGSESAGMLAGRGGAAAPPAIRRRAHDATATDRDAAVSALPDIANDEESRLGVMWGFSHRTGCDDILTSSDVGISSRRPRG